MAARSRAHLVVGAFPAGASGGHDLDYARLRLLEALADRGVPCSVANDYRDLDTWLPVSHLLLTYTAGPYLDDRQSRIVEAWMTSGGRWLALHGSSGGKAARIDGSGRRRMVRTSHHHVLGGFFINHPPVRRFRVDVADPAHPIVRGLPASFEVVDEPYMVEVLAPQASRIVLTAAIGPDDTHPMFAFAYDRDTALLPDGRTRVIAYERPVGEGGVFYVALGHCHSPQTNLQPFVDASVDPQGRVPQHLRDTWETPAFRCMLANAIEWGVDEISAR